VHGTTRRAWPLIEAGGGLRPMARTHVHFAAALPRGWEAPGELLGAGAAGEGPEAEGPAAVSGMRTSSSVLVFLDVAKAMERGLRFWRSENGVVLCDGGEAGLVPLACFRLVEERGPGGSTVLVRDGVVVGQLTRKR
jgi:2'-phosphotransferase